MEHFLVRLRAVIQSVVWGKPADFPHGKVTCFVLRHSKLHRVGIIPESLKMSSHKLFSLFLFFSILYSPAFLALILTCHDKLNFKKINDTTSAVQSSKIGHFMTRQIKFCIIFGMCSAVLPVPCIWLHCRTHMRHMAKFECCTTKQDIS